MKKRATKTRWRNSAVIRGTTLEHASFWLDVSTIDWIRTEAKANHVLQGAILQALVIDHNLRKYTKSEIEQSFYLRHCRMYADMILHLID